MGVQLDGAKISEVLDGGRAKEAGLQVGDVILAVDGAEVKTQAAISAAVRGGEPLKLFKIRRGEETLEVKLDWSQDPDEPRRQEQAKQRAEREAQRKAEREAKKAAEKQDGSKP